MSWSSAGFRQTLWTRWPVTNRADVGAARRYAVDRLGAWRSEAAGAALVVTELGSNLVKHAHGGTLCMGPSLTGEGWEVLAIDQGPGIDDIARSLTDRYSTSSTSGTGLGAISRHSADFALGTDARGTVVYARVGGPVEAAPAAELPLAVQLPHPREAVSGDAWATLRSPAKVRFVLIDALGHGPSARVAAAAACRVACEIPLTSPGVQVLSSIHRLCRTEGLRGAVAAVLDIDADGMEYAAVGTVEGYVQLPSGLRRPLPRGSAGTLGNTEPRLSSARVGLAPDERVVLFTDGFIGPPARPVGREDTQPHAGLIAGRLCRDAGRAHDDATALVIPAQWALQQLGPNSGLRTPDGRSEGPGAETPAPARPQAVRWSLPPGRPRRG